MQRSFSHERALQFMLAGKAFFTVKNEETGNRYTYRVQRLKDENNERKEVWFVSVMTGTDNEHHYRFVGTIFPDRYKKGMYIYRHSKKSTIEESAISVKGFKYVFAKLQKGTLEKHITIYHEGRCGRCGRLLTVPESIISGYGPECVKLAHFA